MRLIVDESTGTTVVAYLRAAGHDVLAVAEAMPQADDAAILERAEREARVLLTNDKDFGDLAFRVGLGHAGILLLRLHDDVPARRIEVVRAVLARWADRLPGRFAVATEQGIRFRDPSP
jgi:predicted nuclease of predicted toxin-antitoxin system